MIYRGEEESRQKGLMRKDKQVEISGGKCVAADVSTASAAIIKTSEARGVTVASAGQLKRNVDGS